MRYYSDNKFLNTNRVFKLNKNTMSSTSLLKEEYDKVFSLNNLNHEYLNNNKVSSYKNGQLFVAIESHDFNSDYENIINSLSHISEWLNNINFNSDNITFIVGYQETSNFKYDELKSIAKIRHFIVNNFQPNGHNDYFSELYFPMEYNLEEQQINVDYLTTLHLVLESNRKLNSIIDSINKQNFSPYEKYLAAYSYVSKHIYKEEGKSQSYAKSRDLISVLTSDNIVCLGYARLLQAICQGVGIPCYVDYVSDPERNIYHAKNIVKIKDDKYNINGIYESDVTQDSAKNTNIQVKDKMYTHHLIPYGLYEKTYNLKPYTNKAEEQLRHYYDIYKNNDKNNFIQTLNDTLSVEEYEKIVSLVNYGFSNQKLLLKNDILALQNKRLNDLKNTAINNDISLFKESLLSETKNMIAKSKQNNIFSFEKLLNDISKTKSINPDQLYNGLNQVFSNLPEDMFLPDNNTNKESLTSTDNIQNTALNITNKTFTFYQKYFANQSQQDLQLGK